MHQDSVPAIVVPAAKAVALQAIAQLPTGIRQRGSGYRVRMRKVSVPQTSDLYLCSLLNRRQFHDPDGEAARLGISSALWPLFGLLWPSAYYLARELLTLPPDSSERILEVGCGLGLPSLIGHRHGLDVTASDFHPLAGKFLAHNVRINRLSPDLAYRFGRWGRSPLTPNTCQALSGHFDLIVASDVLYERDMAQTLARFIDQHARPHARMWLVDANRGYRAKFRRSMAAYGFEPYADVRLNRSPCLSGALSYKGHLMKFRR